MPWSWFLLRDSLGAVSLGVAILLPVLVVLAVVVLVAVVRPRLDRFRLVVDVSRGHAVIRVLIAEDQHLIRGGHVMSMDPAVGNFVEADVLVEGKKVLAVGPNLRARGAS